MTIQITGARISGGVHLGGVIPPPTPFTIQYLVVGGGGGGSNGDTPGVPCVPLPCYLGGGGGGGGGINSSYGTWIPGSTYTVVVGAGGAGHCGRGHACQGGGSSISGSCGFFYTDATGGGGGGGADGDGDSGGSGGGAGGDSSIRCGGPSNGQGGSGGSTGSPGNPGSGFGNRGGSGGGGGPLAGGASGTGGCGSPYSITGISVYYGGGGGGGTCDPAGTMGGQGGGGYGWICGCNSIVNGVDGLGGGGGGAYYGSAAGKGPGGRGGRGVVAVSLPTPTYTGNYTGCVAVTTTGCQTVLTFNSPGTYIA